MGISYSVVGGYGVPIAKIDSDTEESVAEKLRHRHVILVDVGSRGMGTIVQWVVDSISAFHEDVREHGGGIVSDRAPRFDNFHDLGEMDFEDLRALGIHPVGNPRWFVGILVS
jgi:hypothetical protein